MGLVINGESIKDSVVEQEAEKITHLVHSVFSSQTQENAEMTIVLEAVRTVLLNPSS